MTYTPDQVQAIVESAGRTMMMLPRGFGSPQGHRSGWPETLKEMMVFMNEEGDGLEIIMPEIERVRLKPSLRQMNELEMVLDWLVYLGAHCRDRKIPWVATTVWCGMLHHPITGRKIFSGRRLARKFHVSEASVRRWYSDGIDIISRHQELVHATVSC